MPDTLVAKSMMSMEEKAYDAQAKAFLSNKEILARIMKGCVEEYRDCSIDEIIGCIEGTP